MLSKIFVFSATPRKHSFSQELEDVKAVIGQPLKLEAKVMAFPAPEVKWFKDGTYNIST